MITICILFEPDLLRSKCTNLENVLCAFIIEKNIYMYLIIRLFWKLCGIKYDDIKLILNSVTIWEVYRLYYSIC